MHNNRIGNQMKNLFARFLKDESGATAIEYGLIAALISVAIIGAASSLGGSISNTFNKISGNMNAAIQ
jgi:pilus assembly protein Flp/PilA